jgi:eukaryotic-like serine/threonine-protein kinase
MFSSRDRCWKITDFGTASKATSKKLCTTRHARGTTGYRAPEILKDDQRYNSKSDIFALGCITFELTTGEKLFPTDYATIQYGSNSSSIPWPTAELGTRLDSLRKLAKEMLAINPPMRPGASMVQRRLHAIRRTSIDTGVRVCGSAQ